jgi:hypothetical protein
MCLGRKLPVKNKAGMKVSTQFEPGKTLGGYKSSEKTASMSQNNMVNPRTRRKPKDSAQVLCARSFFSEYLKGKVNLQC